MGSLSRSFYPSLPALLASLLLCLLSPARGECAALLSLIMESNFSCFEYFA